MLRNALFLVLAIFTAAWMMGCSHVAQPAVDLAAEESAIRTTDAQWLAAAQARDAEKAASFWSDDATIVAPNSPLIVGKQAIKSYVTGAFSSPDFSIKWVTDKVVVARSGEMAYSTGSDQFTYRTPDKKLVTEHTNGVVVWKKQADGTWKAAIDIWNADAPPQTDKAPSGKK
jgi:uncharacterized protein (TIGR02246 family)